MKNIKRLWAVILCGVVLVTVMSRTVDVYGKQVFYVVEYIKIDSNTGEVVGTSEILYSEDDVITEPWFGGGWTWFTEEQYQRTYDFVSSDPAFPVTVTCDMTITEYYKATYYDVSGVGGEYDSLEELYAAREAAQNPTQPETTAPSPTEEPTQTETATPTLTEEPTQPETPEPTEEPTQPEPSTPVPTEEATQPEPSTPAPTEEATQPEPSTPAPTEEATQPEPSTPTPTEGARQPESSMPTPTERATQPESSTPTPTERATQPEPSTPASAEKPAQPETTEPMLAEKPAQPEITEPASAEAPTQSEVTTQSATEPEKLPVSAEAASRHGMAVIIVLSSILICAGAASGFIFFKKHKK